MDMKRRISKKLQATLTIFSVMLFSACVEDTIRPDVLQDYTPRLVLNSVLTADAPISVRVTSSKAILDSSFPSLVTTARITYNTNLGNEGTLTYNALDEMYTSSKVVQAGEILRIRGEHPDFPTIISEVRVPDSISSSATLILDGGTDTSGLPGDLITLKFQDKGGQRNYYRIQVSYWNGFEFIPMIYPRSDPSFSDINSLRLQDGSILFTDELFDGQEKTVFTVATNGLTFGVTGDKYLVEFATVSSDYYNYYTSLDRAIEAKEVSFEGGFNNAVVIHSNVDNGLGVIATEWRSDFRLK